MSGYALGKFLKESDELTEIVQEIPISWLIKDNKFCKWPPKRFVNIYITKAFPPQDDWEECPIELLEICSE